MNNTLKMLSVAAAAPMLSSVVAVDQAHAVFVETTLHGLLGSSTNEDHIGAEVGIGAIGYDDSILFDESLRRDVGEGTGGMGFIDLRPTLFECEGVMCGPEAFDVSFQFTHDPLSFNDPSDLREFGGSEFSPTFFRADDIDFPEFPLVTIDVGAALLGTAGPGIGDGTLNDGSVLFDDIGAVFINYLVLSSALDDEFDAAAISVGEDTDAKLASLGIFGFSIIGPLEPGGSVFGTVNLESEFNPVPIPGALPLFLSGLIGLFAFTRRRKKALAAA